MDTREKKREALKKEKNAVIMHTITCQMKCRKLPITSEIRIT